MRPAPKDHDAPELDAPEQLAMVLNDAPAFATMASQLKSLDDLHMPATDGFAKLAKLSPRIAEVEKQQLEQAMQISALRMRSGLLVSRWKHVFLVGQSRCWAEFHRRTMDAERVVARAEFKAAQEDEG